MAAPVVQRGVCIVNSEAENAVDAAAIRRLGYKLRTSPSCLPSMLVAGKGGTFAFVMLDDERNEKTWERIDRVHSKGFPNAFVIVCGQPSGLSCASDALLQAVSRYQGKPAFVHAARVQSFTDAAMSIADALDGEHFNSLADQKGSSVAAPDACVDALMNLPGPALEEAEAAELLQLGTLRDILSSTAQDILQRTNITLDRADAIARAFGTSLHQ